jgi:hypothetical protein
MSNVNPNQGSDESLPGAERKPWQRPTLRHLAAKEARSGGNPHNDGQGGDTPSAKNHS